MAYEGKQLTVPDRGQEMYDLAGKIFPICRSITGSGVRETLRILGDYIGQDGVRFSITEVPSGTPVFDWTVPKEWAIRSAWIEDQQGNRIIDMKDNNLHVMGYSLPMDKRVSLEELKQYVYTQPDQPDVIPYITSYYKERSGFCMSQAQLDSLPEGEYHLYIDSELSDGSLTYAEVILPGETDEELLLTSYTCHPSMANNECSGMVLLCELIRYVKAMEKRRYTYRFVLNPETIGAITYTNLADWQKINQGVAEGMASGLSASEAFKALTANPANFRIALIAISEGPNSAVPAEKTPYDKRTWLKISRDIRTYHELCHFVCRRVMPDDKPAILDEVTADFNGIVHALGHYDASLAALLLGVNESGYYGGRLEEYLTDEQKANIDEIAREAYALVMSLERDYKDLAVDDSIEAVLAIKRAHPIAY